MSVGDPSFAVEWEKIYQASPFGKQVTPDGYCHWKFSTVMLLNCALAAVVDENTIDAASLRAWLPRPDDLVYIAQRERWWAAGMVGATHPSLLCARLYADRLGDWDDARAVVDGFLAIPKIEMNPLARIEAWRLLARCRGAKGDSTGACEALELAVEESKEVGFIWMERKALEDMLTWVGGGDAAAGVRKRFTKSSVQAHMVTA
jgi:hypothetical protein